MEGRNIIVDYRYADGHEDRLPALVGELVGANVDIIVAPGSVVTRAVKKATTTIPVVSTTGDPVGSGFIESLGRPGGNITGLSLNVGGTDRHEAIWSCSTRSSPARPGSQRYRTHQTSQNLVSAQALRKAAEGLGITLSFHEVRNPGDLSMAFGAITTERSDAVIVDGDPLLVSNGRSIVEFAASHWLPAMYGLRDFVDAGGFDRLRCEHIRDLAARGLIRRQDPEGCQAGGSAGRATDHGSSWSSTSRPRRPSALQYHKSSSPAPMR